MENLIQLYSSSEVVNFYPSQAFVMNHQSLNEIQAQFVFNFTGKYFFFKKIFFLIFRTTTINNNSC